MESRTTTTTCPECGTENPPPNKFCESCGLHLDAAEPAHSDAPRRRRGRKATDRGERVTVRRELDKARRMVGTVRALYAVFAVPAAGVTFGSLAAVGKFEGAGLVLALSAATTLLLIAGAMFAHLHPLAWTLVLACGCTLLFVAGLAMGAIDWLTGFLTVALWAVMPLMLKIHRLMREHPDLVDTSKLRRRERREGVEVSEARVRSGERERRRSQAKARSFAIVGGVILVVALGIWGISALGGDDGFEGPSAVSAEEAQRIGLLLPARIEEFRSDWARADLDAIGATFVTHRRESTWPDVLELLDKRGWTESLPALGNHEERVTTQTTRYVEFDLDPKGTLKTSWHFVDGAWQLDRMVFSRTR